MSQGHDEVGDPSPPIGEGTLDELETRWRAVRQGMAREGPDASLAETVAMLKTLLTRAVEAGRHTADAGARVRLQFIALEIGDTLFRLEGSFPDTVIGPLAAQRPAPLRDDVLASAPRATRGALDSVLSSDSTRAVPHPLPTILVGFNGRGQPSASDSSLTNPFHPAGTLPQNHPTYVVRACDAELMAALRVEPLIAIEGDVAIGKSSLVLRARASLAATHHCCYVDLQAFRTDHTGIFLRDLFEDLSQQLGRKIDNWRLIDDNESLPISLIIDELGALTAHAVPLFIPPLVKLARSRKERVYVIVCLLARTKETSIRSFLKSHGVESDQYAGVWHRIHVPVLDGAGIAHLLALLPPRAAEIARARTDVVARFSGGHPAAVQRLCSMLCEAESAGSPTADLEAILSAEEAYT